MGDLVEFDIDLEPLIDLERRIKQRGPEIVRRTTHDVARTMRVLAPVRTGELRSEIEEFMAGRLTGIIRENDLAGIHVEYGTAHVDAQPYIRPAVERHRRAFERRIVEMLE